MDARHADRIGEAEQRREVVTDIAPGMVRAVREGDGAGAVFALLPLDLVGDDLDRLVPGDAHVAGLAAVLRIALAVRIEVDALHRVEQAVGRIDDRFGVLAVRRKRGLARRRELLPLGLDGPRGAVFLGEIDRRQAHDLAVPSCHVDEDRPAIGHVAIARGAVGHLGAVFQPGRLRHHQRLRKPVGKTLFALDGEDEVLLRVDLIEPVDRRHQQRGADLGILEHQLDVGLLVQPGARCDLAVVEFVPAPDLLIAGHDLGDEVVLLHPRLEIGVTAGRHLQELRRTEQDDRQFDVGESHGFLLVAQRRVGPRPRRAYPRGQRGQPGMSRFCNNSNGIETVSPAHHARPTSAFARTGRLCGPALSVDSRANLRSYRRLNPLESAMAKLRHLAIQVPDLEKAAAFL